MTLGNLRSYVMPEKRNLLVLVFSLLGGALLIVSGTRGPLGIYETILQNLPLFIKDSAVLSIATAVAAILITLSSLGGLIVIIGGYLVYRKHVSIGKLMIGFGGGAGIPFLLFLLLTIFNTHELLTVVTQHSLTGWTGILLSLIARTLAK